MKLYLKTDLPFEAVAERIAKIALPSHQRQLRDGLNLGGGDYFKFHREGSTVLLVCNDLQHEEVFVEDRKAFPYYCYVREGSDDILKSMFSSLLKNGIECELADEA